MHTIYLVPLRYIQARTPKVERFVAITKNALHQRASRQQSEQGTSPRVTDFQAPFITLTQHLQTGIICALQVVLAHAMPYGYQHQKEFTDRAKLRTTETAAT